MSSRITHIPARTLHVSKPTSWLESRFHFNFANYWGGKENFGALRVVNDDLVKAHNGFGRHPHRNAEIFSYVVKGELTHQDSLGNIESLGRGSVQYLSAGTGVSHSEMNQGNTTCRFLQIWFMPVATGHKPQYGSSIYTKADRHNTLLRILGGTGGKPKWNSTDGQPISLHQDVNVYVSESDAGIKYNLPIGAGRQAYLVCIEGDMVLGGPESEIKLEEKDAAELVADKKSDLHLDVTAGDKGCHFMVMEMAEFPKVSGWG